MITRIQPGARMSEAVVHGDTIYLSGQVGEPGDDVATQTRTALAEIEASTTRNPSSPCTRNCASTTANASEAGPILQVLVGWYWVSARARISAIMPAVSSRWTG